MPPSMIGSLDCELVLRLARVITWVFVYDTPLCPCLDEFEDVLSVVEAVFLFIPASLASSSFFMSVSLLATHLRVID